MPGLIRASCGEVKTLARRNPALAVDVWICPFIQASSKARALAVFLILLRLVPLFLLHVFLSFLLLTLASVGSAFSSRTTKLGEKKMLTQISPSLPHPTRPPASKRGNPGEAINPSVNNDRLLPSIMVYHISYSSRFILCFS